MLAIQQCLSISLILVVGIIILEEFNLGNGYIYLANQYDHEVNRNITLIREATENIGIAIVLKSKKDEKEYQMALDTVRCYGRHFQYNVHVIYAVDDMEIKNQCMQKDLMFLRHCALSLKMQSISNTWLLFLDGDMGVINPNHLIEEYIPKDENVQIVFYNRIMNQEVMAGSYLVRNSYWSRQFLMFWANFENKLPNSFHGSDNGAIHSVILEQGLPKLKKEREFCEQNFWKKSLDYTGLSKYVACAQRLIRSNSIPEIKILQKGRFSWARDGWLTNSIWSDTDFFFHGWQQKRKDKLTFARWHSPLVYDAPWNLTKCSSGKANENWKYKDTFIGSVVDVDRRILTIIKEQEILYKELTELIEKS